MTTKTKTVLGYALLALFAVLFVGLTYLMGGLTGILVMIAVVVFFAILWIGAYLVASAQRDKQIEKLKRERQE